MAPAYTVHKYSIRLAPSHEHHLHASAPRRRRQGLYLYPLLPSSRWLSQPSGRSLRAPISLDELLELRAPHIWLVEAEGNSMSPSGIMNRSRLVVDRAREALPG